MTSTCETTAIHMQHTCATNTSAMHFKAHAFPMYTCDTLGYWMCSHPDFNRRRNGAKLTLHKELQRIFCLPDNEAPAMGHRGGLILRHITRTTRKERDLAGCGCANWTHTVLGTRSENAQDLMTCEGGSTVCGFRRGEDNLNAKSTNENVNRLRIETWILSCEHHSFLWTTRLDATSSQPRFWSVKIGRRTTHDGDFSRLGGGTTHTSSTSKRLNLALSLAPLSGT